MTRRLRLLPSADVARLGKRCYLFDRAALTENVVYVPTQRVSQRMFDVVRRVRASWPTHEAQPFAAFQALFDNPADQSALAQLVQAGYLEEVPELAPAVQAEDGESAQTAAHSARPGTELDYFRNRVLKHYFKREAFFHLPEQIDDDECEVGLVGVPVSSTLLSSGTVNAPARLRRDTQRAGFWFDFQADGVYTETGCNGTAPRLLCSGTRLKDFGDIGSTARTVGQLFSEVQEFIETRLLPHGIRPVFIGGDHAVSFPLVDCYLRHYPDLVLLHLDAHNDLFYTEQVEFNHAGPIHGLLAHSGLGKVLSMGLRTVGDPRTGPFRRMQASGVLEQRVRLYSLGALKRWLQDPNAFAAHLREAIGVGTPCYLTIDLDVLSADCIAGQLSTPAGPGLDWHELLDLVVLLLRHCEVIACDVVEFNPDNKNRAVHDERELPVLLLELIDGLSRQQRAAQEHANTSQAPVVSTPLRTKVARAALPPAGAGDFARPLPVARHRLDELDYQSFLEQYVLPGVPVILTGLDTDWPALARWSPEYFLAALSEDETVEVKRFARADDFSMTSTTTQSARMTLAALIERRARGLADEDARHYIVNWQFADTCAALLGDYTVPAYFQPALNEQVVPAPNSLRWLFVGEPGTGSATHIDVLNSSAWLMLVSGRKHWRMVPAQDLEACGRVGEWVDLFAPDHAQFPHLARATLFEAEQLPGEMLWTPPLCVHAVRNVEHSIAVTQNYIDLTNLLEVHDALIGGPRAVKPQRLAAGLMLRLIRSGLTDLQERGLLDAAQPALERLHTGLVQRRRDGQAHGHGLDAALRELDKWQP